MLVSYIDKKKSGLKNVVVLTTMHNTVRVTKDAITKPDTERTNAMTILKDASDSQLISFEFTWQLGINLVVPHMQTVQHSEQWITIGSTNENAENSWCHRETS